LPEFNFEQVKELANRHQFKLEIADLDRSLTSLMEMVGGFPYLIRQAFYALSTQEITMNQLLEAAPTPSGIYRTHLQGHFSTLSQYPDLMKEYSQIVEAQSPLKVPTLISYKLSSIGVVKLLGNQVIPSCQLYRLYFQHYLVV
jgi:hypothetical protein